MTVQPYAPRGVRTVVLAGWGERNIMNPIITRFIHEEAALCDLLWMLQLTEPKEGGNMDNTPRAGDIGEPVKWIELEPAEVPVEVPSEPVPA